MNITTIYPGSFPYGTASANRVLSYSQEIVNMGHSVNVLCLTTYKQPFTDIEKKQLKNNKKIIFKGINCIFCAKEHYWPYKSKNILKKTIIFSKSILSSITYIIHNRKSIDILHFYGSNIFLYFVYSLLTDFYKIPFVVERAELPDIYYKRDSLKKKISGKIYTKLSEYAFSKIKHWILETQTLVDFYIKYAYPKADYCIVPMTVDIKRFVKNKNENKNQSLRSYIGYCGNMSEIDGISILIKAFSLISAHHPNYSLRLAGESDDLPKQKELVKLLKIEDSVEFLGRISREEVPDFLKGASLLALASPVSERSVATMPCKIGEYLCTGNPVVVTGIGEIPNYLQDGVSAFLSKPDSAEDFADKLEEVLSDIESSKEIGNRGKQVALNQFNSLNQAKRLIDYYNNLLLS